MDENKALGKAGAGQVVRAKGKEWTLLPPTKRCTTRFQAWLESQARRKLIEGKADCLKIDDDGAEVFDAETYAEWTDATLRDIATGVYVWGKKHAKEALQTPAGIRRFLTILVQQAHANVTEEYVEELFNDAPDDFRLALESLLAGMGVSPKVETAKEGGP